MSRLILVAVPVPGLGLLTYRVPGDLDLPPPGARVLVPLGARTVTGCVIAAPASGREAGRGDLEVKDLVDVIDPDGFIPPHVLDLTMWVAEYYACGPGDSIAAAMPPRGWAHPRILVRLTDRGMARRDAGGGRARDAARQAVLQALVPGRAVKIETLAVRIRRARGPHGSLAVRTILRAMAREGLVTITQPETLSRSTFKTIQMVALAAEGHDEPTAATDRMGPRQRDAIELLRGSPDGLPARALRARGIDAAAVKRLASRGLVVVRRERVERDPFANSPVCSSPRALTIEQSAAVRRLTELAGEEAFRVALLHGVTGSGKTEIYVRLAQVVRAAGRTALVLVPEIALTPSVAAAFRTTFGDRVAIQHSGLSGGERHDQWQRIRSGAIDVVVGTRSAVFAPLARTGLIVVDEEQDGSYKQEENPRYHGRDVAVVRGRREGALVVLGSATPSLETYQNARSGRYERIVLERRVFERPLAEVRLVNMRDEYATRGPDVILSGPLQAAMADRLDRHEQVLILLNRRGLATAVFCRQCAATLECPNCSVSLTVHTGDGGADRARCHYCNYSMACPQTCPRCAAPYLERMGVGTELVAAEIASAFPGARVARLDRDTMRQRGAAAALLGRFGRGEVDVLVGTQMIAKGHDFPRVTLVGVVSADVGLGIADFRAAERTFQLLTQVAGRAGRGPQTGEAVIQTLYPEHYSIRHACRQDYAGFFDEEIRFRRAMRYPPVVGLINVVVRAPTFRAAMDQATDLARRLRTGRAEADRFRVLGPAPAPLAKLRGEYRAQLFLKGSGRAAMRKAVQAAIAADPALRRRVIIDVDPVSML